MAEEGNLAVARALEADEDSTKEELQRRMEEARESITQTVSEIKDTVANQYNSVKESVTEALDWREQYRKHPVVWSIGALGVGALVGYSVGGIIEGDDEPNVTRIDERSDIPPTQFEGGGPSAFSAQHSHASHERGIAAGAYASSEFAEVNKAEEGLAPRPSYSSGYAQPHADEDKHGLIDRFKETRAYDRLQEEVGDLGNRFMDELSSAARTIVLPAIFNKIKQMIGVDLSNTRHSNSTRSGEPRLDPARDQSSSNPDRSQPAGPEAVGGSSVSGKPAYPTAKPGGQSESHLHNNINYDDRYERESKHFSRGEIRGFAQPAHGEKKTDTNAASRPADRSETPRG